MKNGILCNQTLKCIKIKDMKKAIVLGGFGFVGKNLCRGLLEKGIDAIPYSRRNGLDLTNLQNTIEIFNEVKPDVIFNCAAHVGSLHYVTKFAGDVIFDNMQMALNLYKSVKVTCPNAMVINPLSNCSYPGDTGIQKEENWWGGEVHKSVFSYGNSKKFIYVVAKSFYQQYKIKSVNIIVPNTFGPGDHLDPNKTHALNGIIIRMIEANTNNDSEFEIWGTGSPIREWAYIDDLVNILIETAILGDELIYPVNLAQKKGYSIKETAVLIKGAVGYKGKLTFNTKYQDGDPVKLLDDSKFKIMYPNFKFFDHKIGIKKTVDYYKNKLKKK